MDLEIVGRLCWGWENGGIFVVECDEVGSYGGGDVYGGGLCCLWEGRSVVYFV